MVRNLRTAGTAELVVGGTVEPIRALATHGEQKGAFLRQYFQQPELRARYALKVDTKYLTNRGRPRGRPVPGLSPRTAAAAGPQRTRGMLTDRSPAFLMRR